jgi:hypothetical protein
MAAREPFAGAGELLGAHIARWRIDQVSAQADGLHEARVWVENRQRRGLGVDVALRVGPRERIISSGRPPAISSLSLSWQRS